MSIVYNSHLIINLKCACSPGTVRKEFPPVFWDFPYCSMSLTRLISIL